MDNIKILIDKFGCDAPIKTLEIAEAWGNFSRAKIFKLLKQYIDNGLIKRHSMGIYYIPGQPILKNYSGLSDRSVIEKKYMTDENLVYGYYSGIILRNLFGLTTQVPVTLEIVTMNESSKRREVKVGNRRVVLKKARTGINKDNVAALQLLDFFNDAGRPLKPSELRKIKEFVKSAKLKPNNVFKYAQVFPAKAIKNLVSTGVENVFTQG